MKQFKEESAYRKIFMKNSVFERVHLPQIARSSLKTTWKLVLINLFFINIYLLVLADNEIRAFYSQDTMLKVLVHLLILAL